VESFSTAPVSRKKPGEWCRRGVRKILPKSQELKRHRADVADQRGASGGGWKNKGSKPTSGKGMFEGSGGRPTTLVKGKRRSSLLERNL